MPGSPIAGRIGDSRGLEALTPKPAGIAAAAGLSCSIRPVTRYGHRVINTEPDSALNNLRLAHCDQRRVHLEARPLNAGLGCERSQRLEAADEFGPAVRIAAVVNGIDPYHQVARL